METLLEKNSYIHNSETYTSKNLSKLVDTYGGIHRDYQVTHTPIIKYASVDTIFGKILDITESKVVIKCLTNEIERSFQIRQFDKEPFLGAVTLQINQFVEIKIATRSGERKFTYKNATRRDLTTIFEKKDHFQGLENTPIFQFLKPLDTINENNL